MNKKQIADRIDAIHAPKIFPRPPASSAVGVFPMFRERGVSVCLHAFAFLAAIVPTMSPSIAPALHVWGGLVDIIAGVSSPPAVDFPWLVRGYTPAGEPIPYEVA